MTLLEMCNESSISAYEKEIERQNSLNAKTDLLFKWLTLLIAVFNFLISFIAKSKMNTSFDGIIFKFYILMMVFFAGAFVVILCINFPAKRKLPSLGSERLRRIQKNLDKDRLDYDAAYRDILYEEMLENDAITKTLRTYSQRIARMIMAAEILMALGLLMASAALGFSLWKG